MPNSINIIPNIQTNNMNNIPANQAINGVHDEGLSIVQSKQHTFKKYRATRQPNQSQVRRAK
jgi:hypothetical protein